MPYIKQEQKDILQSDPPANVGELNYCLTTIVRNYFRAPGRGNYQAINDIVGALEGAKLEFYRRIASPYEDKKIKDNGDVY